LLNLIVNLVKNKHDLCRLSKIEVVYSGGNKELKIKSLKNKGYVKSIKTNKFKEEN